MSSQSKTSSSSTSNTYTESSQVPRTPTPSTPPFLNLLSPDFQNYRNLIKTPNASSNQFSLNTNINNEQLTDMDFESAYALLTNKSPNNFQSTPTGSNSFLFDSTSNQILNFGETDNNINHNMNDEFEDDEDEDDDNDYVSQFIQNDVNEFKDFLSHSNTPSPKMNNYASLNINTMISANDELLSVNETNALEKFLDSIMDDKTLNSSTLKAFQSQSIESVVPPEPFKIDTKVDPEVLKPDHTTGSTLLEIKPQSHTVNTVITTTNPPDKLGLGLLIKDETQTDQIPNDPIKPKRQRRKRKLLSEEEKKSNHTTSEQKRRGLIKTAFDDLSNLISNTNVNLPDDDNDTKTKGKNNKKNQSKSIILEKTALQIEQLIEINQKLREMITKD